MRWIISAPLIIVALVTASIAQPDPSKYRIEAVADETGSKYFTHDPVWRGGDSAGSIDLGDGRVLWLFGDSVISANSNSSRMGTLVRNSVAIQKGYYLSGPVKYYWRNLSKRKQAFFSAPGVEWFWPGHGSIVRDRLIVFLLQLRSSKTGLGFEAVGWYVAIISNPADDPDKWNIRYVRGPDTFGQMAGSAAVLKDDKYLYAFGSDEPATHDAHLLRWSLHDVYLGKIWKPEWWFNGQWVKRRSELPKPRPLFAGATEYSVHFDPDLEKFIQIQTFGFGEASIGLRMADRLEGPWSEPKIIYTPDYSGVKMPIAYSAKAHPELRGNGLFVTYNVNTLDLKHMLENQSIYFPRFIRVKIGLLAGPDNEDGKETVKTR